MYRGEDVSNMLKIEANNGLENFSFTLRNTLPGVVLRCNFEGGDNDKIEKIGNAVQETLGGLVKSQLVVKDKFEAKQKALEGVLGAILVPYWCPSLLRRSSHVHLCCSALAMSISVALLGSMCPRRLS